MKHGRVILGALCAFFAALAAVWLGLGDAGEAGHAAAVAAALVLGAGLWTTDSPRFDSRSMPDGEGWALWRNPPDGRWVWIVWHPSGVAKGDARDETDARNDCWQALAGFRVGEPAPEAWTAR